MLRVLKMLKKEKLDNLKFCIYISINPLDNQKMFGNPNVSSSHSNG